MKHGSTIAKSPKFATLMKSPLQAPRTIVEAVREGAQHRPDHPVFRFVTGEVEHVVTLARLERRARAIAAALQAAGATNERVLLLFPPGEEFVLAAYACFFANAVAVPAYPPDLSRIARTLPRLRHIVEDAGIKFVLTTDTIRSLAEGLREDVPQAFEREWLAVESVPDTAADDWVDPNVSPDTVAFIQYTSGSTHTPRGVVVRHSNILVNSALCAESHGLNETSVAVAWLPLFHDMGLVGHVLAPVVTGGSSVLLDALDFLQDPACWLRAISKYRGTVSGAPNFGYALCTRRIDPETLPQVKLDSWGVAYSGAEPIRAQTLSAFARKFQPLGFRKSAFLGCYGLAEATLIVSGGRPPGGLRGEDFSAGSLARGDVRPAIDGERVTSLVASGHILSGVDVRIVDPATCREAGADRVGEIWVSGPTVSTGYFRASHGASTSFGATLQGEPGGAAYLRTGDLGFLRHGQLFVTGRSKDVIIVRGRNLYPQDLELECEEADPSIRRGSVAVFGVDFEGEEKVVVVAEVNRRAHHERRSDSSQHLPPGTPRGIERRQAPLPGLDAGSSERGNTDLAAVCRNVRQALVDSSDLRPHAVVLLTPGTIHKTSSGKIQRSATRSAFLADQLEPIFRDDSVVTAPGRSTSARAVNVPVSLSLDSLALLPLEDLFDTLRQFLRAQFSATLRTRPESLPFDRPLRDLGLDSVVAVELAYHVERSFGVVGLTNALLAGASIDTIAQRILERARASLSVAPPVSSDDTQVEVPLLPTQRWYFEQKFARPEFWNLIHGGFTFSCPPGTRGDLLAKATSEVFARHEELRLRFDTTKNPPVATRLPLTPPADFFVTHDLSHLATAEADAFVHEQAQALQGSFVLSQGPLVKIRHFFRGTGEPGRLVLAVHHLIIDVVSFTILKDDIERAYRALATGEPSTRLAGGSITEWLERVELFANSPQVSEEAPFWLSQARLKSDLLKRDHPLRKNVGADSGSRFVRVSAQVQAAIQAWSARDPKIVHEGFLAALLASLKDVLGANALRVQLVSSGRRLLEDVDPQASLGRRVVGLWANYFPAFFDLSGTRDLDGARAVVAKTMAAIPRAGDGYALLRYLSRNANVRDALHTDEVPEVMYEYVGNAGLATSERQGWFGLVSDVPVQTRSEENDRRYVFSLIAGYFGDKGLLIRLSYSKALHDEDTMDRLSQDIQRHIEGLFAPMKGGTTA